MIHLAQVGSHFALLCVILRGLCGKWKNRTAKTAKQDAKSRRDRHAANAQFASRLEPGHKPPTETLIFGNG